MRNASERNHRARNDSMLLALRAALSPESAEHASLAIDTNPLDFGGRLEVLKYLLDFAGLVKGQYDMKEVVSGFTTKDLLMMEEGFGSMGEQDRKKHEQAFQKITAIFKRVIEVNCNAEAASQPSPRMR